MDPALAVGIVCAHHLGQLHIERGAQPAGRMVMRHVKAPVGQPHGPGSRKAHRPGSKAQEGVAGVLGQLGDIAFDGAHNGPFEGADLGLRAQQQIAQCLGAASERLRKRLGAGDVQALETGHQRRLESGEVFVSRRRFQRQRAHEAVIVEQPLRALVSTQPPEGFEMAQHRIVGRMRLGIGSKFFRPFPEAAETQVTARPRHPQGGGRHARVCRKCGIKQSKRGFGCPGFLQQTAAPEGEKRMRAHDSVRLTQSGLHGLEIAKMHESTQIGIPDAERPGRARYQIRKQSRDLITASMGCEDVGQFLGRLGPGGIAGENPAQDRLTLFHPSSLHQGTGLGHAEIEAIGIEPARRLIVRERLMRCSHVPKHIAEIVQDPQILRRQTTGLLKDGPGLVQPLQCLQRPRLGQQQAHRRRREQPFRTLQGLEGFVFVTRLRQRNAQIDPGIGEIGIA